MKFIASLIVLFWVTGQVLLMGQPLPHYAEDEEEDLSEYYRKLDSLAANFRFQPSQEKFDSVAYNIYGFDTSFVPTYPGDTIVERLKNLGSAIPLEYNGYVQSFINVYAVKRRKQVSRMLGLTDVYFPMFEEALDRENLPLELKYLPVVESALNTHAVSRVGATGLWQFMYWTGKQYGLKVTTYVDERRDPAKATEAAIGYFKKMYETYEDWLLVIAAYNCGPGNVNKAIYRSGGKRTFWEIRKWLPRETRGYVPAFIAAMYVMNYAQEHNIYPQKIDFSYQVDTVHITRNKVTLQHIAEATDCDFYTLKDLNPELKTNTIPYDPRPYVLKVPYVVAKQFTTERDSVFARIAKLDPDSLLKKVVVPGKVSAVTNLQYRNDTKPSSNGNLVYYTVRSGDVVGKIAERFHVSARSIAQWNNLRNYRISPGQKLKIYSSHAPQAAAKPAAPAKPVIQNGKQYHKVKSGDSLWDIANLYKMEVDALKRQNNLTSNRLMPGQMLLIK